MARLTSAKKNTEPEKEFGLPKERKYPMPDACLRFGTPRKPCSRARATETQEVHEQATAQTRAPGGHRSPNARLLTLCKSRRHRRDNNPNAISSVKKLIIEYPTIFLLDSANSFCARTTISSIQTAEYLFGPPPAAVERLATQLWIDQKMTITEDGTRL